MNVEPFEEYIATHTTFDQFSDEHLALFRQLVLSSALLDMQQGEGCNTLLGITGGEALFATLEQHSNLTMFGESVRILFLPPPVWDGDDVGYPGWLNACGMLKSSPSPALAVDFIHAMVSEKAMSCVPLIDETKWVGKAVPFYGYVDKDDQYVPQFTNENGTMKFTVKPGRVLLMPLFGVSEESYLTGQAFRSMLKVDTRSFSRDFYDAAWAALQEWLYGNIDDKGLRNRMNYLFGIAANH